MLFVFYFVDDGEDVDGLPTEGVEITCFHLVYAKDNFILLYFIFFSITYFKINKTKSEEL